MFRKNVASQSIFFTGVNATTGAALAGLTITVKVTIDSGAQASGTGTTTDLGNGQYRYVPAQAETNGNQIGFQFTATNMVPYGCTVVTTAGDPTDSVRFGLTALPNAAASAVGGLPVAVDTSGRVDVLKINGTSQTARDIGASVLVGDKTGFSLSAAGVQAIWDALTSALTTVGSIGKRIVDNLTGDIYARIGAPAGASVSADIAAAKVDTAAVKVQTDKLTFTVANQVDSNVLDWKSATAPAMTGDAFARLGAAGAGLTALGDARVANLDATVSSRLASASYTAPDNADILLIKAKTDNLPAAPAAVGDIPTANQNADALLDRAAGIETSWTVRQGLRVMLASMAAKLSGAATSTVSIRDVGDTKDRIVATVDANGNRSAITYDKT